MQTPNNAHTELAATVGFIARYASYLMGSGVHTSRVVRNSRRIGAALDVEINLAVFPKSIIVSGTDTEGETFSRVVTIPACPIDFERPLGPELGGIRLQALAATDREAL